MIRVLHYSTHDEDCGIAKYQEQFHEDLSLHDIESVFFEVSPNKVKVKNREERRAVFDELARQLADFDILHIQHEFGFFVEDDFTVLVNKAKQLGKKVVVSVHTSPSVVMKRERLMGLGPRSFVVYGKHRLRLARFIKRHINGFKASDILFVHNFPTRDSLQSFSVPGAKIKRIMHPVPKKRQQGRSSFIRQNLKAGPEDIVFCIVGFLHKNKGVFDAIRALRFLPENYKLAIIGGLHPFSDETKIYNKIANTVDKLNLRDRVYITGFIQDDALLDSYIQECDACVYPYDRDYYASVSSGSLNLAFANGRPAIAYPTQSFKEMNEFKEAIILTQTFAYYELAKELLKIKPGQKLTVEAEEYIKLHSWPEQTKKIAEEYRTLFT